MSDHPKEAERNLKRIRICDDIYFDVFHLLAPAKVGLELALVSNIFDAIVDTHLKSRKWTLGNLLIYSETIDKLNDDGSETSLPFPRKPLPNSIIGFDRVNICSLNSADGIAFLRCIGRLLESDVCLELYINDESNWNTFATRFWPLLNVSAIIKIHFVFSSDLHHLRRLISPSILCDCTNLRVITSFHWFSFAFPPNDSKGASDGQVLCKWLHTPRADGQPKMLKVLWDEHVVPMDVLKKTFLSATTSVSFIILLDYIPDVGPFELINSLTREQLTSRRMDDDELSWLIERSPTDKNAEKWAEWKEEALDDGTNDWKVLGIYFLG